MVSLITIPIFPLQPETYPAFSVHRKPTYATIYRQGRQGRNVGAPQQNAPLWEFELTYNVIRDAGQNIPSEDTVIDYQIKGKKELQKLQELYLACGGPYGEFLFWDSTDHSRETQLIATGDGLTKNYPFIRTITGDAGLTFSEQVGAVNIDESVIVYVDGTPIPPGVDTWGVSLDLLTLQFADIIPLGTVVYASFHYYYRCAWITDEMEFEEFAQNWWSAASIKFRSINPRNTYVAPIPITPITPPVPPIPPLLTNCLDDQQWWNSNPTNIILVSTGGPNATSPGTQAVDKFGNFYLYSQESGITRLRVYGASGGTLQSYGQSDFADKIDSWNGGPIVVRGTNFSTSFGVSAKPIMGGEYVLVYVGDTTSPTVANLARWFAVCTPSADGSLNVIGACYTSALTAAPPYGSTFNILDVSNSQSTSDPILILGSVFLGGITAVVGVLPSINDISARAGGTDGSHPLRIPSVMFYPLATVNLSTRLGVFMPSKHNSHPGFIIPNDAGETLLFFYFSRAYMDACLAYPLSMSKEIVSNIQPFYPHGAILKINLGVVDYYALRVPVIVAGAAFGVPSANYTVDNINWTTSPGGPTALPFTDEYTYASMDNSPGGKDAYEMQPATIVKRPSGKWWVIFFMVGYDDAVNNGGNKVYESFRVFEFDPATEVAVQIVHDHCILHTYAENHYPSTGAGVLINNDFYQAMTLTDEDDGSVTITVHGPVFKTRFFNFTP